MTTTDKKKLYMTVYVIEEIFYRIDAKSLVRLKCVCKLWYSLIKDSYFIGRHLKRAKEEADSSSDLIICSEFDYCSRAYINLCGEIEEEEEVKLRLCSLVGGATASATDGNIVLTKPDGDWGCMLPCCNGLICFFYRYTSSSPIHPIHIFNPATRESLFLPIPNCKNRSYWRCRVELGFHPCTNSYKVLLFWTNRNCRGVKDECHVLTLGGGGGGGGSSNSWRGLGNIGYHLYADSSTCAARGVLYWTVCVYGYYVGSDFIVSFDLGDEKFREIPLPDLDREKKMSITLRLVEMRERVYLVDTYYEEHIDIWVLELEDSPKKNYSWIKEYTIDLVDDIRLFGKLIWFRGEILWIETSKGIVYYDSRTKQITDAYEKRQPEYTFYSSLYIQSLVSLTEWGGSVVLPTGRLCFSDAYEGDMATQEDGKA